MRNSKPDRGPPRRRRGTASGITSSLPGQPCDTPIRTLDAAAWSVEDSSVTNQSSLEQGARLERDLRGGESLAQQAEFPLTDGSAAPKRLPGDERASAFRLYVHGRLRGLTK